MLRPIASLFLALALLSLSPAAVPAPTEAPAAAAAHPADVPTTTGSPTPTTPALGDLPDAYARAAESVRRHRCPEAAAALEPHLAAEPGGPTALARLVAGLHAHACEDPVRAARLLAEAGTPGDPAPLDDWRLLILADSAHAAGDTVTARAALDHLLATHPDSPVAAHALVAGVDRAVTSGDDATTLALIEASRQRDDLDRDQIAHLERLAWVLAGRLERRDLQAIAARRLLTHAPLAASELSVVELFRTPDGRVDWETLFEPEDLERRAEALLDADLVPNALETLERVPVGRRGLSWTLLTARALTAEGRGTEALALLESIETGQPADRLEIEWHAARAALDLSSPTRGGRSLAPERRAAMERRAHAHLARVVALDVDPQRSHRALVILFRHAVDERDFETALGHLARLRHLDPEDTTGAGYLWSLGWEQYETGNHSGAIGYWSELVHLYPETRSARSGRYWTARAFEGLGRPDRARSIYGDIAADLTDFYGKHAAARLGSERPVGGGEPPAHAPWPRHPELERARLLTDLGLDHLATLELDALVDTETGAAGEALEGMVLARQGRYRQAIPHLRRAFPALGGPRQASAHPDALELYLPLLYEDEIRAAAGRTGVEARLLYGMIRQESAFDLSAHSHAGARGLMQLMPATAREVARRQGMPWSSSRLFSDPDYNVRLGSTYFRQVLDLFDGEVELALAGYNGGPYRIRRLWNRAPRNTEVDYFLESLPIEESRSYVKWVLHFSDSYHQLYDL